MASTVTVEPFTVKSPPTVTPPANELFPVDVIAPQPTVPIVAMFLLPSSTNALLAAAVPAVTLSKTPNSAVVKVVVSSVNEVSPVIVPVTAKLPDVVIAPQPTVPKPLTFPLVSNV